MKYVYILLFTETQETSEPPELPKPQNELIEIDKNDTEDINAKPSKPQEELMEIDEIDTKNINVDDHDLEVTKEE